MTAPSSTAALVPAYLAEIEAYWRGGRCAGNIGMVASVPSAGGGEGKLTRWISPILALLVLLPLAQTGQAQDKIRLGHNANSARNLASLPLHILMRQGLFAREGLAVELVGLPGTTHMVDALDTGTVDVTGTATPYLIQAALKGSDAVAVIGGPANAVYSLIAKPEIATAAELSGRLVALSTPADTISLSTRLLLAKHGVNNGDYRTKEIIGSNARGNCLISGQCDAVPLGQPDDIVLVHKGFRKLGDSLEVLPVQQFNVLAARRAWAAAHKDMVARIARAYGAAFKFLRDPVNRNEIAGLIAETTGAPVEVARQILALYYEPDRGVMPKQAEINMAGMAKVIEMLAETGQIGAQLPPAERFVDLQYLQAAGLQ